MDFKKNHLIFLFILFFAVYLIFAFIRPYEDDESQYIIAGKSILDGELNPFKVIYDGHYSNPFQYIMGSPLAPLIYSAAYNTGGIFLTRVIAALFVIASLFLVYLIIKDKGGNPIIPLLLIAFSSSTIALASDGLLDSISLFFLIAALYLITKEKWIFAGVLSGLAMTTKFILVIPIILILGYQIYKNRWIKYLIGILIIIVPFLVLYKDLIPVIIEFILNNKVNAFSLTSANLFFKIFLLALPIASLIVIAGINSKIIKENILFIFPILSILLYQIITLDYSSFMRHLPYAEFCAAIVLGLLLTKKSMRFVKICVPIFIIVSLYLAISNAIYYPSYDNIQENLKDIDGKVLALNVNSYLLIKDMPANAAKDQVFNYYYFSYDGIVDSKIEEYEHALQYGYFDYATVPSYSSDKFPRYKDIENLVRTYYCPQLELKKKNGIDIYKKCG